MRISKKQIIEALGVDWEISSKDVSIALTNIEIILGKVADNLENDFDSAALGDASNLIQVIREGLDT